MKTYNVSLPYPVLGVNDDISPQLDENSINVSIKKNLIKYTVTVDLSFENDEIKTFINDGKAVFNCECECSKTFYRKCYSGTSPHFEIEIPRKHVYGRVNFNCYVMVTELIENYHSRGFNEDYGDAAFNMEVGDILVAFPTAHYDTDIKYDRLQTAGSFMVIRENKDAEDVFFDISGEKIEITMPTAHYNMYLTPSVKGAAVTLHSSLVLNALTYALIQMIVNEDEHASKLWARTIDYRLHSEDEFSQFKNIDIQTAPLIAQRLLKDPYMRMFNELVAENNGLLTED